MPKSIILVGTGDYYRTIVGPSLALLERRGRLRLVATVSRSADGRVGTIPHRIRGPKEHLSTLLSDLKTKDSVVLLGHSNEQHTTDADDLLSHGWRVMLEKPYCINHTELQRMELLAQKHRHALALLEYYLMMKASPLLMIAGKIHPKSFYHTQPGLLKSYGPLYDPVGSPSTRPNLQSLIGTPRFVLVDVLEGQGLTGTLEHRGIGLTDAKRGGGMLQDLGIHAVSTLFAIEDSIGRIDPSLVSATVHTARARTYIGTMRKKFHLPDARLAETYARIRCQTFSGVPIEITVGKYLPRNHNQRRLVIVGSEGSLTLDLSSCQVYYRGSSMPEKLVLECPKRAESKYVPVLEAGLAMLEGRNPFMFNATAAVLNAQRFILNAVKKGAEDPTNRRTFYRTGVTPPDRDG